jgi:hypothetical protein
MKNRLKTEGSEVVTKKCNQLKMTAADGKKYMTDCYSTEDILTGHPIHSFAKGRTTQTLARESRL